MKRLSIIILASIVLASCGQPYIKPPSAFWSLDNVSDWIYENIQYKSDRDYGTIDQWQTPAETMERRTGDCEDMSILWLNLVYEAFGYKGELVISKTEIGYHASARYDGFEFYEIEGQKEIISYAYDFAMASSIAWSEK